MKIITLIVGTLYSLILSSLAAFAAPTATLDLLGNLDARSGPTLGTTTPAHWIDVMTGNFSYAVSVYDSLCAAHTVKIYFYKDSENIWHIGAYIDGADLVGGSADAPQGALSNSIYFDDYHHRSGTIPASDISLTPTWANGAAAQTINLSFASFTQYSKSFSVDSVTQDGTACETIGHTQIDFDGDGKYDYMYRKITTGMVMIKKSSSNYTDTILRKAGKIGDIIISGDYTGDGLADIVVYRPSKHMWLICQSELAWDCTKPLTQTFGSGADVPISADHDGDGILDLAVWRPNQRKFCFRHSIDQSLACSSTTGTAWKPVK